MNINKEIKIKAKRGFLWNAIEKFSIHFMRFFIGVIMARILSPEDYGLTGVLAFFIVFGQTLVDSGLSSGLIQKNKNASIHYSSVFVINLVFSLILFGILYFLAPFIAEFYNAKILIDLSRVYGIVFIINAFIIIPQTKLTININFKTLAKINVISVIVAGIVGITLALNNFGVWSLVFQTLTAATIRALLLFIYTKWKPSFTFSKKAFKEIFSFSSKILFATLYNTIMRHIYQLIIGKYYSISELGHYTRAKGYTELVSGTISSVIEQVTFPWFSAIKDDKKEMIIIFRKLLRVIAFVNFPAMVLLSALSEPIIIILLTEKWIGAVPLLKVFVLTRLFLPLSSLNLNMVKATGRSDLYLKIELVKFPLLISSIIITAPMGINYMIIGLSIVSFISFFISSYLTGKNYRFNGFKQLYELRYILIISLVSYFAIFFSIKCIESQYLKLFIGTFIGISSYMFLSYILRVDEMKIIYKLLRTKIFKKNK